MITFHSYYGSPCTYPENQKISLLSSSNPKILKKKLPVLILEERSPQLPSYPVIESTAKGLPPGQVNPSIEYLHEDQLGEVTKG